MRRVIQIALLLAIIIPFGIAVRWGVEMLPRDLVMIGAGVPIGLAIGMALDRWSARIKERQKRGEYSFWD